MLVVSMLHLQANAVDDPQLGGHLEDARNRVAAVAQAYERLSNEGELTSIDVTAYLRALCRDLEGTLTGFSISLEAETGLPMNVDRAIPLALMVNEIVTNAAKYAYPDQTEGRIWIEMTRDDANLVVSIRDEGIGLPKDFELLKGKGLGRRILTALAKQLDATLSFRQRNPGTEFTLVVPFVVKRE
jgi:two-component sensor histidine kinase